MDIMIGNVHFKKIIIICEIENGNAFEIDACSHITYDIIHAVIMYYADRFPHLIKRVRITQSIGDQPQ